MISKENETLAFVAMCFDNRLQHVYHKVVKPVVENHGYICLRADEISRTGIIIEQVRAAIEDSDLVLCDLTFDNPNVFYELAVAHDMGKLTVMISQSAANIPFDVRHYRIIPYEDSKLGLLDLRSALDAALPRAASQGGRDTSIRKRKVVIDPDDIDNQRSNLFSKSLDFKRYAIKFLGDCLDKKSYDKIRMIAVQDNNPDVIRDAMTALHKINPAKAKSDLLSEGLRVQGEYLVRERVVTLLGLYPPDKELLEHMKEQISDSSWGVRRTVCEVLGKWGKSDVVGRLQEMLVDSEPAVRLAAKEALVRILEGKNDSLLKSISDTIEAEEEEEAEAIKKE